MELQTLSDQYIEKAVLAQTLRGLFGNNFKIDAQNEDFVISVPRRLTQLVYILMNPRLKLKNYKKNQKQPGAPVMEWLRDKIDDLRRSNHYNNNFVPKDELDKAITPDVIRRVLKESNIEKHKCRDIEQSIIRGNLRVFAILVRIGYVESISDLISSDQFRSRSSLDERLPFNMEYLSSILPERVATKFYREQWEYAAPVLPRSILPRDLDDKVVLPILHEKHITDGGFGAVFEITLHSAHHCFGSKDNKFIRKDFRARGKKSPKPDFELELRNLSILGNLKHPYIIELLSAYTWKDTHSIVFPLLGKNLDKFMSEERPQQFQSDESIFTALAHLCQGLEHVHNFVAQYIDLEMIGCHHDLKPNNILLHGSSFVLADFGLSTFKNISNDSETTRKIGGTSYSAPECENIAHPNFEKGRAGRKSDIWAFGCIVAEVLTYVSLGPHGVRDFQAQRAFTMQDCWTFSSFHHGNSPNPEVDVWLSKLETIAKTSRRKLVQLIRRMLQIDPAHRPDAREITIRLQAVALQEKLYPIEQLFDTLCEMVKIEEEVAILFVEHARYQSWKETCGITEVETQNSFDNTQDVEFDTCLDVLSRYRETLEEILNRLLDINHTHLFVPLRHLNDRLQGLLPGRLRDELQNRLVQNTVVATEDRRLLRKTQEALESDHYTMPASKLAKVKLMTEVAEECWQQWDDGPRLDVELALVHLEKGFEHHHLGKISTPNRGNDRHVLIEWLCYGTQVLPETEAKKRTQRVMAVARLLNAIPHPPEFRLLRCSNFFHDSASSRFGLAFDFPSTFLEDMGSGLGSVTSLSELLIRSSTNRDLKPPLGDRFKLSQALTSSISQFHKAGWLHRNISPHNVVFFWSDKASTAYGDPYVIGFSHSRPNDPLEPTHGPGLERQDYQHPEYTQTAQRYQADFDYYSLGIVLLEIAHWKPLHQLTASRDFKVLSPRNFQLALIKQAQSSSLIHTMGTRYCRAIEFCLGGFAELPDQEKNLNGSDNVIELQQNFQRFVVDELAQCSA